MNTAGTLPPSSSPRARIGLFAAVGVVLVTAALRSPSHASERPSDDGEILAHVPARSAADVHALEALRVRAASAPRDEATAVLLARRYIEASRREGDPRQLGAAEAVLAPWANDASASADVLLMRATILQSRHDFDGALVDLDRALGLAPDDAQAWLTRATVLSVKGRYDEALASCTHLQGLVSPAISVACTAPLDALTGHAARARGALAQALVSTRAPDELAYLHSLAGELAFWSGDHAASEQHLLQTLKLDPTDRYSRALYADLLLETGRSKEARELVSGHEGDDALALRQALAELTDAHGNEERAPTAKRLGENFDASRLRGDTVHQREEARLWLARGDSERALGFALQSWAVQHEPWDARLVLEAARLRNDAVAAEPVLHWLAQTHYEAPGLQRLAASLRETP